MVKSKVLFKSFKKGIMLLLPDDVLKNQTHGIKSQLLHYLKLLLRLRVYLIKVESLPHINSVYAVCAHIVTSANPRTGIIPLPRPFLTPFSHRHLRQFTVFIIQHKNLIFNNKKRVYGTLFYVTGFI